MTLEGSEGVGGGMREAVDADTLGKADQSTYYDGSCTRDLCAAKGDLRNIRDGA